MCSMARRACALPWRHRKQNVRTDKIEYGVYRKRNRKAAIIKGLRGHSQTEIIRFFGYSRSSVYDVVTKYLASETSEKDSANPTRKSQSKEKLVRTPAIIERAQELISKDPVSEKISKNLGYEWHYNASNCWRISTLQNLCDKSSINALRDCQDEQSSSM